MSPSSSTAAKRPLDKFPHFLWGPTDAGTDSAINGIKINEMKTIFRYIQCLAQKEEGQIKSLSRKRIPNARLGNPTIAAFLLLYLYKSVQDPCVS